MTNSELKKKISEASEQEWFKSVTITFSFYIAEPVSLTGVSSIYEFVNQQIKGWEDFGDLPEELNQIKNHFFNLRNSIAIFVNKYYREQNINRINTYWQNNVLNQFRAIFRVLPYNISEVDFLMKVHRDTPSFYQGAYHFLLKTNNYNIDNPDFFMELSLPMNLL